LYQDFHRQLLENCPPGIILEIGGGTAHIKDFTPEVVSVDILPFPGIDIVADAHRLPFSDGAFSGVIMLDVLHHLERPIDFLEEASRILKPGGRLAMMEPAMTLLARQFYHRFHHEPVEMQIDPFEPTPITPGRDPFDANQAIPSLLFATTSARKRVEQEIPTLRVKTVKWTSFLAYPLSGGLKNWCLTPASIVGPLLAIEDRVPEIVRKHIAFRMMIVLERM